MTQFRIFLLGTPRLEQADAPLKVRRRKSLAILAYLAVTGTAHSRDALATLFWPKSDQKSARANLRSALTALTHLLGDAWLLRGREHITLNPEANLWLDVAQFRHLITDEDITAYTQAANLYQDNFMAGFTLADCPNFDEWQFFETESLRQQFADILAWLGQTYAHSGDFETGIEYSRRWVALDPTHEPAQRELMKLYARAGQQAAALRQYQEYVYLLDEELSIPPETSTTSLYQAIKSRQFPRSEVALSSLPPEPVFMTEAYDRIQPESEVFVGRQAELERLQSVLEVAHHGQGQVLFVIGGAGRGKTALVQAFMHQVLATDPDWLVVSGIGNTHTGLGDPYLPLREALTTLTGDVEAQWAGGLLTTVAARRLWEAMPLTLPALVTKAPDLIEYFVSGLALQGRAATIQDDAPWVSRLKTLLSVPYPSNLEQKRIYAQYTAVLKTIAKQRPLLLVLEDLHWFDAPSISLLFHLCRQISGSPIFIVGTYRPEEAALSWQDIHHPLAEIASELKRQHGDIWLDLGALPQREDQEFVDAYLDTEPNQFDETFRQALFQKTGGHALFTVELIQHLREQGSIYQDDDGRWVASGNLIWSALPARIEGVIESRIGRLDVDSQAILTTASVEGETFTAEVIARVQKKSEREMTQQISRQLDKRHRLVTAQVLERLGGKRFSHYRFRHHLIQQYLYHNLGESDRVYLHEDVGIALEALYGGRVEKVAVQLARHFREAGIAEKAIDYLLQAGRRSLQLSAYAEAVEHFSQGLNMLGKLPDSQERMGKELMMQMSLGNALLAMKGYTASAVRQTYDRALVLCRQLGETTYVFPVMWGIWSYYYIGAEHTIANDLARQFLRRAQQQEEAVHFLVAQRLLGTSLWINGDLIQAREYLEAGTLGYDPEKHQALSYTYAKNLIVAGPCYLSWVLADLGYPDQARRWIEEALSLAEKLAHPFTSAYVLFSAATVYHSLGEIQNVQKYSEMVIATSTEYNLSYFLNCGTLFQGVALNEQGQPAEAISLLQKSIATFRAIGAGAGLPRCLAQLAKAYRKTSHIEEGLATVAEALALVEQTKEHYYESELYRIRGELLLQNSSQLEVSELMIASAEASFQKAIEIARGQDARLYELRATISLCRLWQQHGKIDKARQSLAEIFGWFSEGFDMRDLQEAKSLLDELSG